MALFQVPGWSLDAQPVREDSQRTSKKRKRPVAETKDLTSAEVNIEKLMSTLSSSLNSGSTSKAAPEKYKKKRKSEVQLREPPPNPQKKRPAPVTLESSNPKPEKKVGKHQKQKGPADNSKKRGDPTTLTSLQRTMKESLDGARFR